MKIINVILIIIKKIYDEDDFSLLKISLIFLA